MATYPALDVRSDPVDVDVVQVIVDDFRPAAIEERADSIRVFFTDLGLRDAACAALSAARYTVQPVDVDDEDWARRSQENLEPVTVGRITVAPPWSAPSLTANPSPTSNPQPLVIVIQPSMGFGTGHHATTRLCLLGLQAVDLADRFVLDVGTGSGILAIAAVKLGAARAAGIDDDADAIQAANESLQLNVLTRGSAPDPGSVACGGPYAPLHSLARLESVEFHVADLSDGDLPQADVVTANLTGALLIRSAARLVSLVHPGGVLVVSGMLDTERDEVVRAFGDAGADRDAGSDKVRPTPPRILWEQHEDGWVALAMKRS